ncbi:MAG: hypothetical protein KC501_25625 [Myxococcales bacterium]|nr:hypothetical protein [Myxococcales bacterium]
MALGTAMTAMLMLCDPGPGACASGATDEFETGEEDLDLDLDLEPTTPSFAETTATPEALDPYAAPVPEPEPYEPPARSWDGGMHFSLGLAPMSTLHAQGFHPGVRYDIGTGMAWQRGRAKLAVGPEIHILQYYGRKKPGFGVDAMVTFSLKHVYLRVGAGTATGIPARKDIHAVRPMMGGLVGGGFVGRIRDVEGQIGVDYDVRIDTTGRVAQTVLVAMRLSFGP